MATNNATNTPQLTANGQLMIGQNSGNPVAATLTAGSNITITNGAGTISIAASGSSGITAAKAVALAYLIGR